MELAPIILFVYNRPQHTLRTLEALALNELANQSLLYIYSDGFKTDATQGDLSKIKEVRKLIKEKQWCKEVIIKESENNIGLSNSVIKGVTEVINKHGNIIVLEDDIVTGKYFLNFMNESLNLYKDEEKVYGISGYAFPSQKKIKKHTYFLPIMSSWGYATWRGKWSKINFNGEELLRKVESKGIKNKLNFNGLVDYYKMLKGQVEGLNDSWAVRFYVSMYFSKGLFLYPKDSLLQNIGLDGSGVHCKVNSDFVFNSNYKNDTLIKLDKQPVSLNKDILKAFEKTTKRGIYKRLKKKIKSKLPPEIIQLIRRKLNKDNSYQKMLLLPRYMDVKVKLFGVEILIPDNASYHFMRKEIFDEEIYKFNTNKEFPYIIDAGANIGLASIYFKKRFPKAEIIAFEPDKRVFGILKDNLAAFGFDDITLVNKGLWNEEKELSFFSEGADAGLIKENNKTEDEFKLEKVEVESLNPYITKNVDFLKIDIEGAETKVLIDIETKLKYVDRIFVEYHSFVGQPQTLNEIINILTKANFRIYMAIPGNNSLKSPLLGLRNYNDMDFQLNIFGYKNKTATNEIT